MPRKNNITVLKQRMSDDLNEQSGVGRLTFCRYGATGSVVRHEISPLLDMAVVTAVAQFAP